MSEARKPRQEANITVVDDLDAHMKRNGAAPSETTSGSSSLPDDSPILALLGREAFSWTNPYNTSLKLRFRRPPGGTREKIARILGSEHCENATLVSLYTALSSIFEINGESWPTPTTTMTFRALKQQIGWVPGLSEDDFQDEPIDAFQFAYQCAIFPDRLRAVADIRGIGLSPDDENRIIKNSGLERPKD